MIKTRTRGFPSSKTTVRARQRVLPTAYFIKLEDEHEHEHEHEQDEQEQLLDEDSTWLELENDDELKLDEQEQLDDDEQEHEQLL